MANSNCIALPLALGVSDSMLLGLLLIVGSPAALAPLVCFLFRAIQWRKQPYLQRRGPYLAAYYVVALGLLSLGLGGFDLPPIVSSADLLLYLLWLAVGIATAIFFLIPLGTGDRH